MDMRTFVQSNTLTQPRLLNLAAWKLNVTTLGPGSRAAIWVQGCPFHCSGCIAPNWIPQVEAKRIAPEDLAFEILEDPALTGITLSGGEPMLQAAGLSEFLKIIRQEKTLDVICYTGFRIEVLRGSTAMSAARRLLTQIDVLIDGAYLEDRNDNRGLRGSSNQRIHHLTERLTGFDFINAPRQVDVSLTEGELWMTGIPPRSFANILPELG